MNTDQPDRPAPPLSRARVLQNARFLAELRRTGNVTGAAAQAGATRMTFLRRRARYPTFALAWEAALTAASARLSGRLARPSSDSGTRLVRSHTGKVQMRRRGARETSPAVEQAFLAALSATANIAWSSAAAGSAPSTFKMRARRDPGFAREMRLALETGYRRLEEALLESWMPEAHTDDAWRHNEPPPIPPMTAGQALHALTLHRKTVEGLADPLPKRRSESWDEWSLRAALMAEQRLEREREKFRVAEAARQRGRAAPDETPPVLPALEQVTGWSKATPRTAQERGEWPFGGWLWDEER